VKHLLILLLLAFTAYGQQKEKIAIINTVDDGEPPLKPLELSHLTNKLREIAGNALPGKDYDVMTEEYIVDFSGSQEEAEKKCEEAGGCLAKLGRDIKVHYIAQGRIGRFGNDLTIKVELYSTKSSKLVSSLVSSSKDIYGLLSELEKKAPDMFKKMLPQQAEPQPQTQIQPQYQAPPVPEIMEKPKKLEVIENRVNLQGVSFGSGNATLTVNAKKILDGVAEQLLSNPKVKIEIQSHTDNQGKPATNRDLSERRAKAVVAYLATKGVKMSRMRAVGYGQDVPIADNNTAKGREQNRRIEMIRIDD